MLIDAKVLDELSEAARLSPRLRKGMDMRNSPEDQSQRMLNALEPGTEVPIHRHKVTTETVAVIRGKVRQKYFDNDGNLIQQKEVKAGDDCPFYVVPKGVWHTTECLESGTIIFDCKDGAYDPLDTADILNRA